MIRGVGIDLVSVNRIEKAYKRRPKRFLQRVFTASEASLFMQRPREGLSAAMAARFAAKEAVLKAIGCGIGPAALRDVEILAAGGQKPQVRLTGSAARLAREQGIGDIQVSITHEPPFAAAIAAAFSGFLNEDSRQ